MWTSPQLVTMGDVSPLHSNSCSDGSGMLNTCSNGSDSMNHCSCGSTEEEEKKELEPSP